MKKNNIDEEIVEALNFSNLALLDKCFNQISYSMLSKNPQIVKKQKYSTKSKFEKVNSTNSKAKSVQSQIQFENVVLSTYSKPKNIESSHHSKIKICSNELDPFQSSSFNNNSNAFYSPVQNDPCTINQFLKQTATSASKKQHSPINAWKASSVQKYQLKNQNYLETQNHWAYQHYHTNFVQPHTSNQIKELSNTIVKQKTPPKINQQSKKRKSKFQKSKSSTKVTKEKPVSMKNYIPYQSKQLTSIYDPNENSIKIDIQPIIPKKNNQLNIANKKQNEHIEAQLHEESNKIDFNDTRDTCQLAPSKLQKLIEVEDNKYKEIVLKTFYKHQK